MAFYSILNLNMTSLKPYMVLLGLAALFCGCRKEVTKPAYPLFTREKIERSGFTAEHYSNVYAYYWVMRDTSDLKFHVYERKADSTVLIGCDHHNRINFTTLLDSLRNVLPEIGSDVDLKKIESLIFKQPLYYADLNRTLSEEYRIKFGDATVDYPKLHTFLLSTSMTKELNSFLQPLHKKVKSYSMEKFHLLHKEQYNRILPQADFGNDPEFSLYGSGIHIDLEEL